MTITDLNGLVASIIGPPTMFGKDATTAEAAGIPHTPWYGTGLTGAGSAPTGALNGATFTGPSVAGQIPVPAAMSGETSVIQRLSLVHAGNVGAAWLVDRLWGNVPVVTTTGAQAVTSPTWPARDTAASTAGAGIYLALEVSSATGNGSPITTTTVSYCVDPATECLTRRGWLRYDALTPDDEILAFDPVSRQTRWERPNEIFINANYSGDMVLLTSREWSALVTPDHRWPVEHRRVGRARARGPIEVRRTSDLPRHEWSLLRGAPHAAPDTAAHSDAFVRLVAWYVTEGTLVHGGNSISLCQSATANPAHVEDIRRDLKEIGALRWADRACVMDDCTEKPAAREMCRRHYHHWWTQETKRGELLGRTPGRARRRGLWVNEYMRRSDIVTWSLTGHGVDAIVACAPGKDKVPTMEFLLSLTRKQAEMFVQTCIAGDGTPERQQFYQWHDGRMTAFVTAAVLAGYGPTVTADGTTCSLGRAGVGIDLANVRRQTMHYVGPIWCPVTESGHWVARRNGKVFITGNTNSAGTSGRTATCASFPATGVQGTFVPLSLAAGDIGVRSVQSITLGTSYVSGQVHLVAFRLITDLATPLANTGYRANFMDLGMPTVWDATVMQLVLWPSGTAVGALSGSITYAQG